MNAPLYLVSHETEQKNAMTAEEIAKILHDECGIRILPYHIRTIQYFLDKGNQDVFVGIIAMKTAEAYRPSFQYFEKVLRNCNDFGIFTMNDWVENGEKCRQNYIKSANLHYI